MPSDQNRSNDHGARVPCGCEQRGHGWRARWSAIGAALAIIAGLGGLTWAGAANEQVTASTVSIAPCRIMDTRPAPETVGPRSTPLGSGTTHTIQVRGANGNCRIPQSAASVLVNVTVVGPQAAGFITVFPAGVTRPTASNLNYVAGQNPVPNLVNAALGATGQLSFFASGGPVNLIADITGYTTAARLTAGQLAEQRWDRDLARPATVAVDDGPTGVAFDGSSIWVTAFTADTVSRIDPATNTVTATVPVGDSPVGVAYDGSSIWVANFASATVSRVNPATATVTATVAVGNGPYGVAFDGSSIWVTNSLANSASRIDVATNAVTATVPVGSFPVGVAFDGSSIWVANAASDNVSRISATADIVTVTATVTAGDGPEWIAFDGANIWVTNTASDNVSRIDPDAGTVTGTVAVGDFPVGIAFDGRELWVANSNAGTVSRLDPASGSVTATIPIGVQATGVAFDGANIWVANFDSNTLSKLRAG